MLYFNRLFLDYGNESGGNNVKAHVYHCDIIVITIKHIK